MSTAAVAIDFKRIFKLDVRRGVITSLPFQGYTPSGKVKLLRQRPVLAKTRAFIYCETKEKAEAEKQRIAKESVKREKALKNKNVGFKVYSLLRLHNRKIDSFKSKIVNGRLISWCGISYDIKNPNYKIFNSHKEATAYVKKLEKDDKACV